MNKVLITILAIFVLSGCDKSNVSNMSSSLLITPGEMQNMVTWCESQNSRLSFVAFVLGIDTLGIYGKVVACDNGNLKSWEDIVKSKSNATQ